ncbi:MAG: hypothetical protein IPL49_10565 [Saprospirales bacterium]|nr:hypothetical protein [Saprospirales bacterium]MBK8491307.1 hypothetical protein [Saprospirales bacterium]
MKDKLLELVGNHTGILGITPGGYYSLRTGAGRYQIIRMVAIEECGVHFVMYGKPFEEPPTHIDPQELKQTPPLYMPFRWWSLFAMGPQYLMEEPVDPGELADYQRWKKEDGRYWGD